MAEISTVTLLTTLGTIFGGGLASYLNRKGKLVISFGLGNGKGNGKNGNAGAGCSPKANDKKLNDLVNVLQHEYRKADMQDVMCDKKLADINLGMEKMKSEILGLITDAREDWHDAVEKLSREIRNIGIGD